MIVFKACMNIIKRKAVMLIIYFGIFTSMTIMLSKSSENNKVSVLDASKNVKMTIINNDNSAYADSFIEYFDEMVTLKDIVETKEGISDALFYRVTEYIIVIPEGFGDKIEAGEDVELEKYEVAGSFSGMFMDSKVNDYVAKLKVYGSDVPKQEDVQVNFLKEETKNNQASIYNFSAYAMMVIIILGTGTLISRFKENGIRNRNNVSPMKPVRQSLYQILGGLVFTLVVWIALSVITVIFVKKITTAQVLMIVNMFVFSLVSLSIGFFINMAIKSENGRNIAANVFALGTSFIGGVMVPLEVLGDNVLLIGSFTPAYWFVKSNEVISTLSEFNMGSLEEVIRNTAILLLFTVAFLTMGLAVAKKRAE